MLIFLDTEFTDFLDCDLISIGMVSEDGQHQFYAERSDYEKAWASQFVQQAVLPHLGRDPAAICTREELTRRLWAWFATLPCQVQIGCDSMHDRDLLWDAFEEGLPANLDKKVVDLRSMIDTAVFNQAVCAYHGQPGQPWHHALHDALAHRQGWLAWSDSTKAERSKGAAFRACHDPVLEAAKRESQEQSRELVRTGQRSQASMFLFSPEVVAKLKVEHKRVKFKK